MKTTCIFCLNLLLLLVLLAGCTVEPKLIPYGQANCTHCSMTVADNRFGAELVNDKGKPYYFDAAECLAAYLIGQPEQGNKAAFLLVSDFTKPGELLDARSAYYLQSQALPSPMGMNLVAVADKAKAKQMQQQHGANLLSWEEVLTEVKNNVKFRK